MNQKGTAFSREAQAGRCWSPEWTHFWWPEKGSVRNGRVRKMSLRTSWENMIPQERARKEQPSAENSGTWSLPVKWASLESGRVPLCWAQNKLAGWEKGPWGDEQESCLAASTHTAGPSYFLQCVPPAFPGLAYCSSSWWAGLGDQGRGLPWGSCTCLGFGIFIYKTEIIHAQCRSQSFWKSKGSNTKIASSC